MRIIIIGCGRLGSRLAQSLTREGHSVSVVDKDRRLLGVLGPGSRENRGGVGFDRMFW